MAADGKVVAPLAEGHAEHLFGLLFGRNVVRVNLDDVVTAFLLFLQKSQCFRRIAGGNDAVGDLAPDDGGGDGVTDIAEGDPVAETAHAVCASGAGVGARDGAVVQTRNVVHEAGALQFFRQGRAETCRSGAHVFEAGRSRLIQRLFQFLDQLPAVQSIQEVDVAGAPVQDRKGQFAATLHGESGRLLIGIAPVFQFKFSHARSPYSCLLIISCWTAPVSRFSSQP